MTHACFKPSRAINIEVLPAPVFGSTVEVRTSGDTFEGDCVQLTTCSSIHAMDVLTILERHARAAPQCIDTNRFGVDLIDLNRIFSHKEKLRSMVESSPFKFS
jgi:hypothetical protein